MSVADESKVRGERGVAAVAQALSLQTRASSVLAVGLMSVLGLGTLAWYYAHALTRQSRERQTAQGAVVSRARAEMPLPAIGPILPPAPRDDSFDPVPQRAVVAAAPIPLDEVPTVGQAGTAPTPAKSASQLALERQLAGTVFASQAPPGTATPTIESGGTATAAGPLKTAPPEPADFTALLHSDMQQTARADVLPSMRLLLPKGAFIDCTLQTAIDSTLPGLTTCVTATDTFGADGRVVLLERGTKLMGETKGEVHQGAARLFVLWTEARTPTGVVVPLSSPGADELGRAGLSGTVNRHFWQRFGAAMLVSVLDGAVQAAAESRSASGTVILNPAASQDVMTDVLKGTIGIAPTVTKRQGDRIQILVARDLDFRSVYALHTIGASP
jgi:type IV secretion system protein VirB10